MQAIALEERQVELSEAGDEARAQRDELSLTASQLADAKRRAELHRDFADRLAASRDRGVARSAGAGDAGRRRRRRRRRPVRRDAGATTRAGRAPPCSGSSPRRSPEYAMAGGEGAGARAVSRRDVVHVPSRDAGFARAHARRRGAGALGAPRPAEPRRARRRRGDARRRDRVGRSTRRRRRPCSGSPARPRSRWPRPARWRSATGSPRSTRRCSTACARGSRWSGSTTSSCSPTPRWSSSRAGCRCRSPPRSAPAAPPWRPRRSTARPTSPSGRRSSPTATSPTADELEVGGMVLERYTAPVDDASGARIGRLVVLRDVSREREAERLKSDLMATGLARAAHAAGLRARLRGAAADAPAGRRRRATRSSGPSTARRSGCRR